MEPVNGLLEIPNGEQRAGLVGVYAHAAVKIVTERADYVPLGRVGILCFIHKNMINLPIQLKPHPIRHLAMLQQGCGAPDHIVKVNRAKGLFGFAILRRKFLTHQQSPREPVGIFCPRDFAYQLVRPFEHFTRQQGIGIIHRGMALRRCLRLTLSG